MQRKNKVFLRGIGSNYPPRGVAFCDGALMKRPRKTQMDTEGG